jgi:hypothetical protein
VFSQREVQLQLSSRVAIDQLSPEIAASRCGIALDPPVSRAFANGRTSSHFTRDRIMMVKITPNDKGNPNGKLAEAELHFTEGMLQGLKLVGFAIWERKTGGGRNVTFPARSYTVNGDRRNFALLRPTGSDTMAQDRVRELILQSYSEHEAQVAVAS